MAYDFDPPPTKDNWRTSSTGDIGKLTFSVCLSVCLSVCPSLPPSLPPSVCLSRFLNSDEETVRGICTKFSGWIDPPGGRVLLHFSRVHDARGTWHVPPRKGLHKFVRASTGQMRLERHRRFQTCRSHVYYPNLCAFVVAVPVGCRLHTPGLEHFFDVGSSGARKF